jgi:PAS domain S-box-containing protein
VCGIINTANNITQFVHSKIAVQRAEEMLRLAAESADLGTWFVDGNTRELTVSNRTKELFGYYAHENFVMETALAQIRDDYRKYVIAAMDSAIIFGENYDIEYPIIGYHDKRLRWLRVTGKLYESESGESPFLAGTVFDITDRKMHQLDMETKHRQEIFEATLITQENERKRIAESLHNSLGQLLYSIQLRLITSNLSKKSEAVEEVQTDEGYTARLLNLAIKECRRISHELTPTILEDFGLKHAVNDICMEISDDLPVKCEFTGLNRLSDKYIEITLYRTIQELVMNIIKHAKATKAIVKVEVNKTGVNLTVSDNGIGFQNHDKSHGIGLKTIQNKIKLLNGKFKLSHGQNLPTVISIHIPNKADKIA